MGGIYPNRSPEPFCLFLCICLILPTQTRKCRLEPKVRWLSILQIQSPQSMASKQACMPRIASLSQNDGASRRNKPVQKLRHICTKPGGSSQIQVKRDFLHRVVTGFSSYIQFSRISYLLYLTCLPCLTYMRYSIPSQARLAPAPAAHSGWRWQPIGSGALLPVCKPKSSLAPLGFDPRTFGL